MKLKILGVLYALILLWYMGVNFWLDEQLRDVHAQSSVVSTPFAIQATAPSTACPAPQTATTFYCFATDGLMASINGAKYVALPQPIVAAGVTQITVNGGTPQTGAVVLTIPTKALIPATTATTAPLQ